MGLVSVRPFVTTVFGSPGLVGSAVVVSPLEVQKSPDTVDTGQYQTFTAALSWMKQ